MSRSIFISAVALVCVISHACQASGQVSAVGLYYPDLRAMRTLIGPTGTPNLPAGTEHTNLANAWKQLSSYGRDLLLKERDLALVIVDSNGNWLYRTTGVHTLRSLKGNQNDLDSLRPVLGHLWFQQLRNFYDRLLFAANTSSAPNAFGELLANVNDAPSVTKDDKNWFRSVVGAELRGMDNNVRKSLLLDQKYGRDFVDAIALAEATRNAQLQSVEIAIVEGAKKKITFDAVVHFPTDDTEWTEYNVRNVGGKKLIEVSSMGSVCWLAAKNEDADLPVAVSIKSLLSLINEGKALVFLSGHGTSEVYGVEPKK